SATITRTFGTLPFGDIWYETGTADKWKFTSYERDSESGLDYAMHRYYNNGFGRFQSLDLLPGRLGNPQSLNRYAYVTNDPINLVDPQGLNIFTAIWNWLKGNGDGSGNPNDWGGGGGGPVEEIYAGGDGSDGAQNNSKHCNFNILYQDKAGAGGDIGIKQRI